MAIAFVRSSGSVAVKTTGVQSFAVPAAGHAVGNTMVVVSACGFAGTGWTMNTPTDSKGNTYLPASSSGLMTSPTSGSFRVAVYVSQLTTDLVSGDTIGNLGDDVTTGNFTVASAYEFSGLSVTEDTQEVTYISGGTTTPSAGPITPVTNDVLLIGSFAINGPTGDGFTQDSDTVGTVWNTLAVIGTSGQSATTNLSVRTAYKILTNGTSNSQTYDPTLGTSRGVTGFIGALRATASGPSTYDKTGLGMIGP